MRENTSSAKSPPALNAGEAEQMKASADGVRMTLMFNFNNRARPESYAMRDYIAEGAIGRINSRQARWIRRCGLLRRPSLNL